VQFSAATYSTAESIGSLPITVTRTGSASGAFTVDYATSDGAGLNQCSQVTGQASARCDYETTLGTLRFAAGDTSKQILVPIIDDSYAEGTENFSITLSNPTGITLGSPSTVTVTITDNEITTGMNPIDPVTPRQLNRAIHDAALAAGSLRQWTGLRLVLVDYGVKRNILRSLRARGVEVVSHDELKRLSQGARAAVRTGEFTPYANIVLFSGVVF